MPFISTVLGYDVFNPAGVIPEFTADVPELAKLTKESFDLDSVISAAGELKAPSPSAYGSSSCRSSKRRPGSS
ncbi:hypothetical protein [Amycolatopsis saalfeldensis]|uniref:Uncharacterized protein n=1 Tax=Amycolatopsis saalfeldensis TaxID=394193 RepID=A0A1H8Y0E1_9PSEU|nr:hypothetical protein [Amycolatopsis saalfeldensis]SEP45589.1 hypothetical protein SAMN04489732_11075 [Amycolatopsis saalfeldensis]